MKYKILILSFFIIAFFIYFACDKLEEPLPPPKIDLIPSFGRTISSIDIFWSEYEGDDFERYEIYVKESSKQNFKLYITISNIRQVYTTIADLFPNTYYDYFVRLVTKSSTNIDSKISTVKTFDDQPSPILIYEITDITYHSVRLTWSSYKDDYAVDFSRYEIHYSTIQDFKISNETLFASINKSSDSSWVVTNLREKCFYYFKIRTYNVLGKFSESHDARAIIPNAPPTAVSLRDPVKITDTSIIISWTPCKDSDFVKYEIHISNYPEFTPNQSTLLVRKDNKNDTLYRISDLKSDKEYFIKILVYDIQLSSVQSNEVGIATTFDGNPVPVELYEPILLDNNNVQLRWSQSVSTSFVVYFVHKSTTPNFVIIPSIWDTWVETITGRRTTEYNIKNLLPNTTYYFKIQVQNTMFRRSTSNEKSITTGPQDR